MGIGENRLFDNQPVLLSYKQAAQFLGISETHLRRLKNDGHIKAVIIGYGTRPGVKFAVSDLLKWVEERKQ